MGGGGTHMIIEQLNKVRVWWGWGTHMIIKQLNKVSVWWGWGTHMIIEQLNKVTRVVWGVDRHAGSRAQLN